jgi:hypothetical protein
MCTRLDLKKEIEFSVKEKFKEYNRRHPAELEMKVRACSRGNSEKHIAC